jgi:hypothetical protein
LNNNNIVSTKRISAMFLAIVLVTGTFALSAPSFMKGSAQAQLYYSEMDIYDKPYEKDRDKFKDNKVNIKKIKCNNINININNGQGGIGNSDNENTTNGNENTTEGFKKINKDGFTFICINNNNNVVAGGGGNQIIQPEPQPTCEECFSILSERVIDSLLMNIDAILTSLNVPHEELLTIGDLCKFLETSTYQDKRALLNTALNSESVPAADINSIISCLEDLRIL